MSSVRPAQANKLADQLMRAVSLMQQGDLNGAENQIEAVLDSDPHHPVALHLLGTVCLQRGELDDAADYLGQSLRLNPGSAAANCDLGLVHAAAGRFVEARSSLEKAVELRPDFAEAWYNLARVLGQLADAPGAMRALRQALARKPALNDARLLLGVHLIEAGRPREAEAELKDVVRRQPNSAQGWRHLGRALDTLGQHQEAVAALRRATEIAPNEVGSWAELGTTLFAFGDRAGSAAALERALALAPARADLRRTLAALDAGDRTIEDREREFRDISTSDETRMYLGFDLGAVYERRGDYDRAFAALSEANNLRRRSISYMPIDSERAFAEIEAAFTPDVFAAHPNSGVTDDTPIFVLGMPRSGTTVVEQILASHPDVFGAGELPLLRNLVAASANANGMRYQQLLQRLDNAALGQLGGEYVRQLRGYSASARHITDKMPGNFLLIGFIKLCLPNAKVIHCVRDPLDTCFSIYRNFFTTHLNYAYDLEDVGHYYRLYQQLMDHWRQVLPGFVYDLSYEALVADQEGETRRLLDHCGLDFRPECLAFHETDRAVHTASALQVRSPMNASSIGIASRYGALLDPLRRALEGER